MLLVSHQHTTATHGGADVKKPFLQRKLAGIFEGLRWVSEPSLMAKPKRQPTQVKLVRFGFGRTGTTSIEAALRILGFSPLQDDSMHEVTDIIGDYYSGKVTISELMEEFGQRGFDVPFFYHDETIEWVDSRV